MAKMPTEKFMRYGVHIVENQRRSTHNLFLL